MPQSRRNSLHNLAEHILHSQHENDIDRWLSLKGVGPWTVNYAKLRSGLHSDVWLSGDAGIDNALLKLGDDKPDIDQLSPWRSYATLQLWNYLLISEES